MIKINQLLDTEKTIASQLFEGKEYPWEVLEDIKAFILSLGATLPEEEFDHPQEDVWIAKDAKVFPSAYIAGPCIIDKGAEVRHCAFIRGSAIIGKNAVVGNSTELKNVVLFDGVQVPHYNYVGDSILGHKAHMGAGSITSNVKGDKKLVVIKNGDELIPTGRKKVGAILGDFAEIGC
ncbi:MAG: UDP-N-acetylglucosamine pyrophosphorylase, partial [Oscillospiraceae bacterium]|nr:UDP-N-acetylglucosamine pyrophosphorylase [Oscillospiraceae bacterium]